MATPEQEKIFIELIKENERLIYKVCSIYRSTELPIADLFQEVIYNLWLAFPKFRNECAVSTWIYRIALNTCISGIRKKNRRPVSASLNELAEQFAEADSSDENIREMYRSIQRLRNLERAIVLLYLEERSYDEIADITGLTRNNVAVKLMRIKEKLRSMNRVSDQLSYAIEDKL